MKLVSSLSVWRSGIVLLLAASLGCGAKVRAEGTATPPPAGGSAASATRQGEGAPPEDAKPDARKDTVAEPLTQQRVARALDPQPGTDRCGGYTFDGVSLRMSREDVEKLATLVPIPQEAAMVPGFEGRTYGFRAARPGRIDDVQIGFFESTPPVVGYIHASILVAPSDAWPRTLFDRLGAPKSARISEWIWWDMSCETTLRLSKVDALDGGSGQSYSLDVRHTLKPAGEEPSK